MVPRCAAIHDLSGFGRCSLSIIMPVLSAMGVQCCPLPTAYLSTHTGGFSGNTFLDMTDAMASAADHWEDLGLAFQAVYTGFMASQRQIALVGEIVARMKRRGALAVIDPVMGDHGRPYRTYTKEMCQKMVEMAALGDVITPNLTEAALLLEGDVPQDPGALVRRLSLEGRRSVVLTGAVCQTGSVRQTGAVPGEAETGSVCQTEAVCQTGAVCFDRETGEVTFIAVDRVPGDFHGTGDLFASVLAGGLLQGKALPAAARQAAEFVRLCVAETAPSREGVAFEPFLGRLAGQ